MRVKAAACERAIRRANRADRKEPAMAYRTILVNIDIDGPVAPVVNTAIGLARSHDAKLIAICAADAPMPMGGPEAAGLMVDAWLQMRTFIEERFREVRAEFERLTAGSIEAEWRQTENNRRAKYYALTRAGRKQLEKEQVLWERMSGIINLVMQSA